MNKQIMIKHYETTPKETLIDILVASREEVEKLQNRNKEYKREIERLNNIINKLEKWLEEESQEHRFYYEHDKADTLDIALYKLEELKGSE